MAFWACCSSGDDLVSQKVKSVNAGCSSGKEVIRPSTVREFGTLNVEDFACFNAWLLDQEKPTYKQVLEKFAELRHRRWAYWHIMAQDNPMVDASCSMFTFHLGTKSLGLLDFLLRKRFGLLM